MSRAEHQLKRNIHFDDLPPSPAVLKPGFSFSPGDYHPLGHFTVQEDNISVLEASAVVRDVVLGDGNNQLFLRFIVNSSSGTAAREETISSATLLTSLPVDAYGPGPAGIGEFSIALKQRPMLIHFVRNNIGITVFARAGVFDVVNLAKQIDGKILTRKDLGAASIQGLLPQMKEPSSPLKVRKDTLFNVKLSIEQTSEGKDLLSFFEYDDAMLNLEDQDGPKAAFRGMKEGETVVRCTVVRKSDLLSSSRAVKVVISDK